jgi:hypothetical protein
MRSGYFRPHADGYAASSAAHNQTSVQVGAPCSLVTCVTNTESECQACDQQDVPERQVQAVRQPCQARRCACRRPLATSICWTCCSDPACPRARLALSTVPGTDATL